MSAVNSHGKRVPGLYGARVVMAAFEAAQGAHDDTLSGKLLSDDERKEEADALNEVRMFCHNWLSRRFGVQMPGIDQDAASGETPIPRETLDCIAAERAMIGRLIAEAIAGHTLTAH